MASESIQDRKHSASLLRRLAEYHGAEFIDDSRRSNCLCFRFKCGNEAMTWDKVDQDGHAAADAKLVTDARMFLDNYIGKRMFLRMPGSSDWSDDFNNFGLRMIKASSYRELELKLTLRGY